MIQTAAGVLISYLTTFLLIPIIIKLAHANKLFDIPDERKLHTRLISSLGGIAIFSGITLSLLLTTSFTTAGDDFRFFIAAFLIIFIVGVIDDITIMKSSKKLLWQLLAATIICSKTGLINNLQGVLGIHELGYASSYIVTFFFIILSINAFNLIDGVDGLAGSLGFIAGALFGVFFLLNGNIPYAILSFSLSASLLAFLIFNFFPAKIFMGDSGSMLIGLITAVLYIKFINTAATGNTFSIASPLAVGFGAMLIPIMDVARVFFFRLKRGNSPFAADRNHIHHILLSRGYSHATVTNILMLSCLVFAFVGFITQHVNINIIIALQIACFYTCVAIFRYGFSHNRKLKIVSQPSLNSKKAGGIKVKVFSLTRQRSVKTAARQD
jgi:UDP-N-acetylmuramyl pentapeptide phosphotransferase/UDP-N-acetylglucosamine-1-phosphate transferase